MIASCCPRCGALLQAGPRPRFCPSCGGDLAASAAPPVPSRKPPLLLIALGILVAILGAGALLVLRKSAESRGWTEKKDAALAAARGGSAGMFRRAWDEAVAAAAQNPERLPELRSALDRQVAADFPAALSLIRERARAKMAGEALTDWKALQAVNLETPESDARRAREGDLRALGIDVAQGAAQAELAAGRIALAFDRHRTACDLCAGTTDPDARRRIHQEMEAPLARWLGENRDAVGKAVASGNDLRIAEAAGQGARILAGLRAHESGPGGMGSPSWSPDLLSSYENLFATVPVKRVRLTVTGDEAAAALVRSLCTIDFPYELDFRSVASAAVPVVAPPGGERPAWLTVMVTVDWVHVDYKKHSGLTFSGDYRLPVGVAVSCSYSSSAGGVCPWPAGPWERTLSSPDKLEVFGKDEIQQKDSFIRQKQERQRTLDTDLRTYLAGWKPWALPAPENH